MAYQQSTKDSINQAYQDIFGRDASFGTLGGADYWADQMDNQGLTLDDLKGHLTASAEGQSVTTDAAGNKSSWIGGVNPNQSIANTWASDATKTDPLNKSWASHFDTGGALAGDLSNTIWAGMSGAGTSTNPTTKNVAGLLNATYNTNNPNSTLPSPYYQNDPITADTVIPGGDDDATFGGGTGTQDGWWNQFADADAFKEFLQGDQAETPAQSGGVDDFMKFMMFMSMMRPQGGMGGGSQYGYGGLNPGGVMSAYNPMDNITSAISAFQSLPGIGTNLTNTGAAAAA